MPSVRLFQPMSSRDPSETHRASTPLELFFDLTFVVAVAQATTVLHHELVEGHVSEGLLGYPIVFFAIWWAWMNFTWFASAYDTDDAAYRVAVIVQMAGVLVFAAGVPRFLRNLDAGVAVTGYVIMRIGLVAQWLRASFSHPEGRTCARRYALGVFLCEIGWVALVVFADGGWWVAGAVPVAVGELAVPVWAERAGRTPWHPGHIGERYGLFTIIVLGESVLSATTAFQMALDAGGSLASLITVAIGGVLVVAAMWWVYFDLPIDRVLARARDAFSRDEGMASFVWGYGHFFVFASAAATGVGLAVAADQVTRHSELTDLEAAFTLTIPVIVYLAAIWVLHAPFKDPGPLRTFGCPVASVLVLASSWTPEPVLLTGLVLAGLVVVAVLLSRGNEVLDQRSAEVSVDHDMLS